jgi:hypothetical protein
MTRAEHAWFASLILDKYSIVNPKSYLVCSKRYFRFIRTSYLITEAVSDIFSLDYFKKTFSDPEKSSLFYSKVIKQLAMVHNAGVFHSDAKLWNFYAYYDANNQEQIAIWDLDGAVIYHELPMGKRIKDLSRAIASMIELNKEVGFNIYNSDFIDKIILSYEKYSACVIERGKIEKLIRKLLKKKKIFEFQS